MSDAQSRRVIEIVADVKRIPAESLSRESALEDLGVDSLDAMSIIFDLENEFSIEIPDEQAAAVRTVGDLIDGVRRLTAPVDGVPLPQV